MLPSNGVFRLEDEPSAEIGAFLVSLATWLGRNRHVTFIEDFRVCMRQLTWQERFLVELDMLSMAFSKSPRYCAYCIISWLCCLEHIRAGASVYIIPERCCCVRFIIRQLELMILLFLDIWLIVMTYNWVLGRSLRSLIQIFQIRRFFKGGWVDLSWSILGVLGLLLCT